MHYYKVDRRISHEGNFTLVILTLKKFYDKLANSAAHDEFCYANEYNKPIREANAADGDKIGQMNFHFCLL